MKSKAPGPRPPALSLPLLVEIGCEEIPARFLAQAQNDFGKKLQMALENSRLLPVYESPPSPCSGQALQNYSTPRRLVAYVPAVLAQQPNKVEEVMGPPVKVAFDAEGKPTRAAQSFAEKNQGQVEDLIRITTPKGEYLAIKKTTHGRTAAELLGEILPAAVTALSFPKSMYWTEKSGPRFVRPIRWLLALLGEGKQAKVIVFEVAGVKSSNVTYGHRSLGLRSLGPRSPGPRQEPIRVQGFNDYVKKLRQSRVEFDSAKRRERVQAQIKVLLEKSKFEVIQDDALEDWVVSSNEWPHALLGGFEERFLKLPREILITVMRDHQKYFAVEDEKGSLQPHFVTVLNREGDPKGLIRSGHERVLTARFRDAEFFWQADQKIKLADRRPLLERVTYQAKLGSYADKVRRMEGVAQEICQTLEGQGKLSPKDSAHALRAVQLCKCDLTTQMVQEFTELQGIVGGLYAAAQGEPSEVAEAIYDHYRPAGLEDTCPRSLVGAVISLADRVDSVVAGFAVGNDPTGSSDPFGLRRQGNGVIKIIVEMSLPIRLDPVIDKACAQAIGFTGMAQAILPGLMRRQAMSKFALLEAAAREALEAATAPEKKAIEEPSAREAREEEPSARKAREAGPTALAERLSSRDKVLLFLWERLGYYLKQVAGLRYDTVRAVLAAPWGELVPVRVLACARDLERIRTSTDFLSLSQSAKRIRNILKKSAKPADYQGAELEPGRLEAGPERGLYEAFIRVKEKVEKHKQAGEYYGALESIASLRSAVDLFFDKILVMAEDSAVRMNRLRLLQKLDSLFADIADLSEIESAAELPSAPETPAHRELKARL